MSKAAGEATPYPKGKIIHVTAGFSQKPRGQRRRAHFSSWWKRLPPQNTTLSENSRQDRRRNGGSQRKENGEDVLLADLPCKNG